MNALAAQKWMIVLYAAFLTVIWISGPAGIAIAAVIVGGFGLKSLEGHIRHNALKKADTFNEQRKALNTVVDDPDFGIFNGYVCPTWEHNRLEKALDGTDFIPCDNIECAACYPHGKCAVADCNLPATDQWPNTSTLRNEWLCNSHFTIREEDARKFKARKEEFSKTRLLQEKAEAERLELLRIVKVEGVTVRRPDVVPEYANAKWYVRSDYKTPQNYIVWKWIDPETGKEMFTKSYHPETWDIRVDERLESVLIYSPDEPQNHWTGTWVQTGEYQKPRRKENKQITNMYEAGKKPKAIAKKASRIGTETRKI